MQNNIQYEEVLTLYFYFLHIFSKAQIIPWVVEDNLLIET